MYYYIVNEEIKKLKNTEAEAVVKRSRLKHNKKSIFFPDDGSTKHYWERDVVTEEVPYVSTIASNYTKTAPPTIKKSQKLSISEAGEWVIEDKTPEEISRDMAEEFAQIDRETEAKIFEGFEYDGKRFSLSLSAQANWIALLDFFKSRGNSDLPNNLKFPDDGYPIATKDDEDYQLTVDKAPGFFVRAAAIKEVALAEGREKKKELRARYSA